MLPSKHYMFDKNCSGSTKRSILKFENIQIARKHGHGGWTDWQDEFSDELCLSKRFTVHSGTAGTHTPVQQLACKRWGRHPTKNHTQVIWVHA